MIEVEGLSLRYGRHLALDGVSLSVARGETVVVLGANGAGKSSLIKALAGMVRPEPGARVTLDGAPLLDGPPHRIVERGVAVAPEGRGVFPGLTVAENLALGARPARARAGEAERREQVLDLFPRLRERLGQSVASMSGGEQQMVAIGRALMSAPDFLLLDEPSLGLAPILARELFSTLAKVKRSGVGLMLVEQSVTLSLGLADRGFLMQAGRIVDEGTAEALRSDSAVMRAFLGR